VYEPFHIYIISLNIIDMMDDFDRINTCNSKLEHYMFHTLAFYGASIGSSYEAVSGVTDGLFTLTTDSKFVVGDNLYVFAGWAGGGDLTGARVSSPSLVRRGRPLLRPWTLSSTPGNDPNMAVLLDRPTLIPKAEKFTLEAQASGTSVHGVLFVLKEPLRQVPAKGDFLTLSGNSSASSTANQWTEVSVNWDETLPNGKYAVIGSECHSTDAVAHRWIFDSQQLRPGGLSTTSGGERTHSLFYDGKLGVWGEFTAQVPPRLEVFTTGISSDHTVYLQVVRVDG